MFVDVHSHVVPSGDDGAQSLGDGLGLCRLAAEHGTSTLFATPHVWPEQSLSVEREATVRAAHGRMAAEAASFGLDLRLGFELTPSRALLDEEPARYRLGELPFVLMELPFWGDLELAWRLAEHVEGADLTPLIAHPERAESVHENPRLAYAFAERWPVQVNASSLLGRHGSLCEQLGWQLVEEEIARIVASDGHRTSRPAVLDDAYVAVAARVGEERALPLFSGQALELSSGDLPAGDGFDVAQRRQAM